MNLFIGLIIILWLVIHISFVLHYRKHNRYQDQFHTGRPAARWAFFEKFVISRHPGEPYLTRWRLIHTPWFGILLHKIESPDVDPDPHDHPWEFVSIVLKGGYTETVRYHQSYSLIRYGVSATTERFNKWKWLSIHRMHRGDYHRITNLSKCPTWTLILTGPRRSDWGFLTPDRGHVAWRTYLGLDK